MDLQAVIAHMETGEQDAALAALQGFNREMSQCFTFRTAEEKDRQHLGELVVGFLSRNLQPSCLLACLETVRILSRDKRCLDPFITRSAMSTLATFAGIATVQTAAAADGQPGEGKTEDKEGDEEGEADASRAEEKEAPPPAENPDLEVIVEALKSICNILLHNETGQAVAAELQLIKGVAERLKHCNDPTWSFEVRFFDLRLCFLLTALRVDVRAQLAQELHGISLLGNQLDATLGLCWPDPLETARVGLEGVPPEELPPLSRQQTELAMEILKILFNVTFDTNRRKVDEEEAAEYRHLGAILRHCLMSRAEGEERTEEFHSHTVNLLGNLPLPCLDVLLMPKVQQGSIEYMGVNMDAVNMLLDFMEKRLDRGHKLKETLLPSLNLLTESARIHRETRKFLRSKVSAALTGRKCCTLAFPHVKWSACSQVLPPLRDVKNRPEVGNTLRNKIVRLMTHIDTDVKDCAAEFLFVLCKESVSRFIKYTGYGNAAGLLAARGLLRGGRDSGIYSEDEDSETEEYREAKAHINPVTGVVEEDQPNPMEGMSEEQKEYEAMKLVSMFNKLSRGNLIQPMQLSMDGTMREMTSEDLQNLSHNPLLQPEERRDADSEEEEQ
ncbi:synembryn-A isoform X3 [Oryzias melastigma]|uniref:synembryn-A isoform X3 n=1 Tax=Oryzias melastigma TaxID=30732 RepID=UPI000CF7B588|nr:synembryn-A isoform X3 [Oryzias melastigma]